MNINPLWFSTLVAVNLQTAPSPTSGHGGLLLETRRAVLAARLDLSRMLDLMGLQVIGLVLVCMFPQIAPWLPHLLFGR